MDRELMVSMLDMDDWVFGGDYSVSHHVDMATGTILDASCIRSCPEIVEYGVVEVSARRGDVEITFREGVSFVIGEPESLTTEYGDETYEPDVKSRWSVLQAGRPFNVISEGNIVDGVTFVRSLWLSGSLPQSFFDISEVVHRRMVALSEGQG